jgi:hypothetical protein
MTLGESMRPVKIYMFIYDGRGRMLFVRPNRVTNKYTEILSVPSMILNQKITVEETIQFYLNTMFSLEPVERRISVFHTVHSIMKSIESILLFAKIYITDRESDLIQDRIIEVKPDVIWCNMDEIPGNASELVKHVISTTMMKVPFSTFKS